MADFRVVVVGTGAVGDEMVKVLRERKFPMSELRILARSNRKQKIAGEEYDVRETTADAFDGIDIAFFAGTEGERGASQLYGWGAVERGVFVVDNGDDYRMDPRVPLVVPEVNGDALDDQQGFVSNPNCSTIQMVVALAPLHRAARIRRVVVTTFQSVSGTGSAAVAELERQVREVPAGQPARPEQYPHPVFANVIPQVSTLKDIYPGYYGEEIKMIRETRKILSEPDLALTATCVRVPVFLAHSEAINVEFEQELSAERAREILSAAPGVVVVDDPARSRYPMPIDAAGKDEVFVGRIREDPSLPNTLDLWCVSDNIRKGAATNAIQIAEKMIAMGLL